MKKTFRILVMMMAIGCFAACVNAEAPEADNPAAETAQQNAIDVDTTDVAVRGSSESGGFGRCLKSGCNCKEFEGRGETCRNCGHAYKKHY